MKNLHIPVEHTTLANGLRVVDFAGPLRAGRHRRRLLSNRFSPRAARPQRLRPSFRAHDVPGFGKRRQDGAHSPDQFLRRHAQRHHELRHHQLFRIRPLQRARTRAVARSRSHARAESGRRKSAQPARRGERRSPRQRDEPALRRFSLARSSAGGLPQLAQRAQFLRRFCRSRRRHARRRADVLPHLLLAQQRRPADGRRPGSGRRIRARQEIFRKYSRAPAAAARRRVRTAANRRTPRRSGQKNSARCPAIAIGYTVPPRGNPDWYAASILDRALHGGRVGPHLSPPRPRKANRRRNRWRRGHHRNQRPHANGHAHFPQARIHRRTKRSPNSTKSFAKFRSRESRKTNWRP